MIHKKVIIISILLAFLLIINVFAITITDFKLTTEKICHEKNCYVCWKFQVDNEKGIFGTPKYQTGCTHFENILTDKEIENKINQEIDYRKQIIEQMQTKTETDIII